jgi:photosynthetic reaction center cytochrome c subunit
MIPPLPPFVKWFGLTVTAALVVLAVLALPRSTTSVQTGYISTNMIQILSDADIEAQMAAYDVPEPPWPLEGTQEGPLASEVYENVPVLGHLPAAQFDRLMASITEWVSPDQGCTYCHSEDGNFAADNVYTKIVSRRMFQMTMNLNANWAEHVAPSGVTCYTCHRGQPVPENIWFDNPDAERQPSMMADMAGQNIAAPDITYASLPMDPFNPFLVEDNDIRVIGDTALPTGNRNSIKQTEWTYSLMIHMSDSLGVNCTYCHNSRIFSSWEQSPPARATAWYGIRMVREMNTDYLIPLQDTYPDYRLGPLGDAPKANCGTCHYGVYKPLFGANVIDPYPGLAEPGPDQEGTDEQASMTTQ